MSLFDGPDHMPVYKQNFRPSVYNALVLIPLGLIQERQSTGKMMTMTLRTVTAIMKMIMMSLMATTTTTTMKLRKNTMMIMMKVSLGGFLKLLWIGLLCLKLELVEQAWYTIFFAVCK